MKKDFINNGYLLVMDFDNALEITIKYLKDNKNYTFDARCDLMQDFSNKYPYFNSSKLDRIIMENK